KLFITLKINPRSDSEQVATDMKNIADIYL
ncbi:MAG: hypothetical protein ACJA1I_000972, partial [Zhongshania marina]